MQKSLPTLAFGTAQIGLPYGVANTSPIPTTLETAQYLQALQEAQITTLESALLYGDAHVKLAQQNLKDFQLITKLPAKDFGKEFEALKSTFGSSLYGVLLHHQEDLEHFDANLFRSSGVSLGVSVYEESYFQKALNAPWCEMIELPFSVFDQRALHKGWLDTSKALIIRSVFLQGLLMLLATPKCPAATPWLARWHGWCAHHGLSPLEAAFGFIKAHCGANVVVLFGGDNLSHIHQSTIAFNSAQLNSNQVQELIDMFAHVPEAVYDPRLWS